MFLKQLLILPAGHTPSSGTEPVGTHCECLWRGGEGSEKGHLPLGESRKRGRQHKPQDLQDLVQNGDVESLVLKLLRIAKGWQQSRKASTGLHGSAQVTRHEAGPDGKI